MVSAANVPNTKMPAHMRMPAPLTPASAPLVPVSLPAASASADPADPQASPQFASLYVGDLHKEVTEAMLYEIFNAVGPIASIRVCRDNVTRVSLGYAYVNFHAVSDAERALSTLNYSKIRGRSCRIMWSHRDPNLRKSGTGNVFVKNLDKSIDNLSLYNTFSLFGNILSCKVSVDDNGRSNGYGFVHYETVEGAQRAVNELNNRLLGEKIVYVGLFTTRHEREKPEITNFTNLYLKNFPVEWNEDKLRSIMKEFGDITSIAVKEDKRKRKFAFVNMKTPEEANAAIKALHSQTDYRTEEEKENTKDLPREFYMFYCQRAQPKNERNRDLRDKFHKPNHVPIPPQNLSGGVNLYVKNLDDQMTDEGLTELFDSFGTITSAKVMHDDKGRCKGFGFVCYQSPHEATKAVTEMHLKVYKGKPLYVGLAEKKEERTARLQNRYKGNVAGQTQPKGQQAATSISLFPPGSLSKGMKGGMHPALVADMKGGPRGALLPGGTPPVPDLSYAALLGAAGRLPPGYPGLYGLPGGKGAYPGLPRPPLPGYAPSMLGAPPPLPMAMDLAGKGIPSPLLAGGPVPGRPMMIPTGMKPMQPGIKGGKHEPLTSAALAQAPPGMQKQMLGEKLFPLIAKYRNDLAGKITGMMLEMDNQELISILNSEAQLRAKVDEAVKVLNRTRPGQLQSR